MLLGLRDTLNRGIVRVLEFEYHVKGKWTEINLITILNFLGHYGFDCFWQGNRGQLWQLSGCWDDLYYNKRRWSNVVCVHRNSHSYPEFVSQSRLFFADPTIVDLFVAVGRR